MPIIQVVMWGALSVLVLMTALWIVSLIIRDSSIVDIFWGIGFVMLMWLYFFLTDGFLPRKILLAVLVTVWGLRLSIHILNRNWGKGEDFRYARWRAEHGRRWWWYSYFQTFLLQGSLLFIISAPLLAAQISPRPDRLTLLDVLAAMVWTVGFFFEAVGDAHLLHFKRDPANQGKLLISGLWTYTRHPNYFGDAVQWWAFFLIALSAGGWWSAFSPVVMTYLLVRVSGVAMLEESLADRKPGYRQYMQQTPAFIPGLPRRRSED